MKQLSLAKIAIATTTFACTALLSVSWSEQRGASLSIESAQARVGRPLTPVSVAGVARRQNRRAAYGYGGFGYRAAAVCTGAVVASGYYGKRYYGNPNDTGGLVGGDDPGTAPSYYARAGYAGRPYYGG